ncbi:nephrin-like [Lycorma delicatula]|uniref:nephrin-like n=1 Tax=Lycorma delicatula TaxID=130591 RepID=UPI003F5125E1
MSVVDIKLIVIEESLNQSSSNLHIQTSDTLFAYLKFNEIDLVVLEIIESESFILEVSTEDTTAVVGSIAKLPCDIVPPIKDDKVSLVIWYKEDLKSPIYTYDTRKSTPTHWAEPSSLHDRAEFLVKETPAVLRLQNVKESDKGVYRCRVDFKKSPTRNIKVNLFIIIPPQRLSVLDEKGEHIQDYKLGPYNEGASVNVTCIAFGGKPQPRVIWWHENTLLDETWEVLSEKRVKNVLWFERLERHHLNSVYTCQASNNEVVSPISSAVSLDLNLRPLWVKLLGENKPLSAEQTHEINCEVVGARPKPFITWLKGNTPLKNTHEEISVDGNRTVSTLSFVPTVEDYGKFLSCRASTPGIPDSNLEDGWKLNISHVPIVSLELGGSLNASGIKEGADVYFECNIKSNPWVYRVSWRHNGKMLYSNMSAGMIVSNQSLVLQSVSRTSGGIYTCIASNQEGDGESNPLYLDIKYIPVCRPGQQKTIGVARGETVRVLCEVEANPPEVDFSWKFNSSRETIDLPPKHFTVDKTRSLAGFTPRTELDYGTLYCWAGNVLGKQKEACVYTVIPAGKPDSLRNCTIANFSMDSLQIECTEGFDGGLPQEFMIEVYNADTKLLLMNYTSTFPWFFVSDLSAGQKYDIILYATNSKGLSDPTIIQASTLKLAVRGLTSRDNTPLMLQLTPLLGTLVGIVAALTLVALIIVLIMRIRETSDDEKSHSKMSSEGVKECSESAESVEKNPDIIPHSNEYSDNEEKEKTFESFSSRLYPQHVSLESNIIPKEQLTYAELPHGSSVYTNMLAQQSQHCREPQIQYTHIDSSMCHATAETPLICSTRESTIYPLPEESHELWDTQQHVVTATRF